MEPWFNGTDGIGLSVAEAKTVLGAHVTPGKVPKRLNGLSTVVMRERAALGKMRALAPREGTGGQPIYVGVRGTGWVFTEPVTGVKHVIPVAIHTPEGFSLLSEAESRLVVERKDLSAVAQAVLPEGFAQEQSPQYDNAPETDGSMTPWVVGGSVAAGLAALGAYFILR